LRIFFCILWALYYLAPSGLTASLGVGTSWSNDLRIVRVSTLFTSVWMRLVTTVSMLVRGNPIDTTACCAGLAF